ncbi:MAG: pseudouridine synthase [Phycisphaerales bacterium JB050]
MQPLRVVWSSDHELVVEKPAGLPSEATYRKDGNSAQELVREGAFASDGLSDMARSRLGDAVLPHRIDAITEGLLVLALSKEAAGWHGKDITARRWRKLYVAALPRIDDFERLLGVQKAYLVRKGRRAERVRAGGKPAFLDVLAIDPSTTERDTMHALIDLKTGRYHQIRVMMEGLGVPLIGDRFYNGRDGMMLLKHVLVGFRPCGSNQLKVLEATDGLAERGVSPSLIERVIKVLDELDGTPVPADSATD